MQRLPPLNAVRVFEAAARHESFHAAAAELNVTPSAVSHAIKSLEEFFGQMLFRRAHRQVSLSRAGAAYLPAVQEALQALSRAGAALARENSAGALTLSVSPSFAVGWLVPRLSGFQLRHPQYEVRLSAAIELIDFSVADMDAAVRTGSGHWPGLISHRLMTEEPVPVCSPALLTGPEALSRPEDLEHATLLHDLPRLGLWQSWLSAAGVAHPDPVAGPKFQTAAITVEAAAGGLGVALSNRSFVAEALRLGRLAIPFDITVGSQTTHYLVYPEERAEEPRIIAFRDWLLVEARGEDAAEVVA
jgi:LysR family glycine cleavage system transcriptional activator